MKSLSKIAVGTAMLASLAMGATEANAGVTVGVAVGAPVVAVRVGNPCFGHRYRCAYPLYGRPIFVDGVWYRGPVYARTIKGERYLWFRGRWERERMEWRR